MKAIKQTIRGMATTEYFFNVADLDKVIADTEQRNQAAKRRKSGAIIGYKIVEVPDNTKLETI